MQTGRKRREKGGGGTENEEFRKEERKQKEMKKDKEGEGGEKKTHAHPLNDLRIVCPQMSFRESIRSLSEPYKKDNCQFAFLLREECIYCRFL